MSNNLEHQLQLKEDDVEALRFQIDSIRAGLKHQVQCELAARSRNLICEVTALRAKVSRMRAEMQSSENEIRERVKRDYDDLVRGP